MFFATKKYSLPVDKNEYFFVAQFIKGELFESLKIRLFCLPPCCWWIRIVHPSAV